jgi:hypothetical protein
MSRCSIGTEVSWPRRHLTRPQGFQDSQFVPSRVCTEVSIYSYFTLVYSRTHQTQLSFVCVLVRVINIHTVRALSRVY